MAPPGRRSAVDHDARVHPGIRAPSASSAQKRPFGPGSAFFGTRSRIENASCFPGVIGCAAGQLRS